MGLENLLEIDFPLHRNVDFVKGHALGFKGK